PNRENAYYPFAGLDLLWARGFKRFVMEDLAYDVPWTRTMWWRPSKYRAESIRAIDAQMRAVNIIDASSHLEFLNGDAELERSDNNFNAPEWTLILKGGLEVIHFLRTRFSSKPLLFGAIILVTPTDKYKKLKAAMASYGYKLLHFETGQTIYAPNAMALGERY